MTEKAKNKIVVLSVAVFFLGFFVWCLFRSPDAVSDSERRPLADRPSLSTASVLSGKFMQDFESFCLDQFPMRDSFRTLKALTARYLFGQRDVEGIYTAGGYVSRLEYPMDRESLDNAAARFGRIYEKYLEGRDVKIYLSVIPDKNFFLAGQNGYPVMDYEALVSYLREQTEYMEYIDIFDCLALEDYYKTDTHWRQEKLTDVAEKLAAGMGASLSGQYGFTLLENPFYGVYYGQSALPLPAEQIYYLESDVLDACRVYDHETDKEIPVYDMEKAWGKDPYEMFLSGPKSLLVIRNPAGAADRRLIVFRDSFGSSLVPLLAEGYGEVTLIDIRYLSGELLGNYVEFEGSDVLFLYSTLVLNNSETLK
ncbi:MAG: hypothetical protein NC517_05980 [Firmicutes bacterium]|nr:hypothetical protein [Bacillota bacterium]